MTKTYYNYFIKTFLLPSGSFGVEAISKVDGAVTKDKVAYKTEQMAYVAGKGLADHDQNIRAAEVIKSLRRR